MYLAVIVESFREGKISAAKAAVECLDWVATGEDNGDDPRIGAYIGAAQTFATLELARQLETFPVPGA